MKKDQPQPQSVPERRRYKRINKNFIMTYFDVKNPSHKFEITQLKNIGMGGMCFVTSKPYLPDTVLGVELKTPYISETTYLEGIVLASHEKVKNMLYETRMRFNKLDPQSEFLLAKVINFFVNEQEKERNA